MTDYILVSNNKIMAVEAQQSSRLRNFIFPEIESKANSLQLHEHLKQNNLSRVARFNDQYTQSPGPGSYQADFKDKHTSDFHVLKQPVLKQGVAKQYQWIIDNQRLGFAMIRSHDNNLGPGYYQFTSANLQKSHSGWPKQQRFYSCSKIEKGEQNVGPGSYDQVITQQHKNQKTKPLSVFKSKSPKTFFEQLVQKNQKNTKLTCDNPQKTLMISQKDSFQLISRANNSKKKLQYRASSMFKSKCQRSVIVNQSAASALGPGSYQISSQQHTSVADKLKQLASEINHNLASARRAAKTDRSLPLASKINPGPGSYNLSSISTLQLASKKAPLGIINKQERFKIDPNSMKDSIPGPGNYMCNRYTMVHEQDIRLNNKGSFIRKSQKNHDFGTAARSSLINYNQSPFGQYNLNQFDLSYRLIKQKQHDRRLQLMDVTLPAFNTKSHI